VGGVFSVGDGPGNAVNEAPRQVVAAEAHRVALLRWLDDLDAEFGSPTRADIEVAERLLDEVEGRT
jgi:hypothetical protein